MDAGAQRVQGTEDPELARYLPHLPHVDDLYLSASSHDAGGKADLRCGLSLRGDCSAHFPSEIIEVSYICYDPRRAVISKR